MSKENPIIRILNEKMGERNLRIVNVAKKAPPGATCQDCSHFKKVKNPPESHCFLFHMRINLIPCEAFHRNDEAMEPM